MTLKRLLWVLIPLTAALLLLVLVLPPRALPDRPTFVAAVLGFGGGVWRRNTQEEHRWAIERARDGLRGAIAAREHGAADARAAAAAGALRSSSEPLTVVRDAGVPDSSARGWLRAAEAELARIPKSGIRGSPVILALHTKPPVEVTEWMLGGTMRDRFQWESPTARACIVDVVFRKAAERGKGRFDLPSHRNEAILGRCVLYARLGFPGAEVGRWAGIGPSWSGRWNWWYGDLGLTVLRQISPDTLAFRQDYGGVPWTELLCLRGEDAYCASLAGLSHTRSAGGGAWYSYYWGWGSLPTIDRFLAELIQEGGMNRFATFWTSNLPPDSALRVAYGKPAGALLRDTYAKRYVPERSAQPGVGGIVVALGWVVAIGALAMGLAWRREMDA